jgi:hypothetical protein
MRVRDMVNSESIYVCTFRISCVLVGPYVSKDLRRFYDEDPDEE